MGLDRGDDVAVVLMWMLLLLLQRHRKVRGHPLKMPGTAANAVEEAHDDGGAARAAVETLKLIYKSRT